MSRAQVLNLENEKSNVLYVGLNDSHNPTNTSGFSSLNPTYTKMAKVLSFITFIILEVRDILSESGYPGFKDVQDMDFFV